MLRGAQQQRLLTTERLSGEQEHDALDYFILFEAVGAFITSGVFAFMIWLSNRRRNLALKGDEVSALKIVLPCWRPLYIFLTVVYMLMALSLGLTFVVPLPVVSQFLVLQFTSLVMLALFSIVPLLLTQKSVSYVAFRRTAWFIGPWFVLCVLMWSLSDLRNATQPLQIVFWILSCVPSLVMSVGILFRCISSRIQMGSTSNRASVEYMLIYTVFFLGINIACVDSLASNNTHHIWELASLLASFSIIWNQLFPLALHRTLLADTKFWRGMGRHNRAGLAYMEGGKAAAVHKPTMDLGLVGDGLQKVLTDIEDITIDFAYIQLIRLIGEGASAKVYRGMHKQQSMAIKVFTPPEVTEELIDEFVAESKLLASLQHENIVSFHGICIRPPQIALVMELCVGGNLKTNLTEYPAEWRRDWRVRACYDAAKAVAHLHHMGYIHRDLKAENFFIGDDRKVKLGDFGEATKQLHHRAAQRPSALHGGGGGGGSGARMSIVGTVAYMAPELVAATKKYSESIDVYSLGITMWEIWTGCDPYAGMSTFQIYEAVTAGRRPVFPDDTPPQFAAVVSTAWGQQHDQRPLAAELAPQLATILKDVFDYDVPRPVSPMISADRGTASGTTPSSVLQGLSRKLMSPLRASDDGGSSVSSTDGNSPGSRLSRMIMRSPMGTAATMIANSLSSSQNRVPVDVDAAAVGDNNSAPQSSEEEENQDRRTSRDQSSSWARDSAAAYTATDAAGARGATVGEQDEIPPKKAGSAGSQGRSSAIPVVLNPMLEKQFAAGAGAVAGPAVAGGGEDVQYSD